MPTLLPCPPDPPIPSRLPTEIRSKLQKREAEERSALKAAEDQRRKAVTEELEEKLAAEALSVEQIKASLQKRAFVLDFNATAREGPRPPRTIALVNQLREASIQTQTITPTPN